MAVWKGCDVRHIGTQRIETNRLVLRRFALDDAQAMYENWASDGEVTRFLTWPAHQNVDVSKAVLEDWVARYRDDSFYQWAIAPKELGDEPIGSISVVKLDDGIDMAHIGYCIGRRWWHQGIVSEALRAVMDFLFVEVGANRVEAYHDTNNPRSGSVMRRCGMSYEGTMRAAARNNQGICDICCYAALRADRQV